MEKVRYMISDAAEMVHVESHVLRYWEEELDLAIPRNEMGHRYYTRENIKEFQKIKELKDQGYQLKAIRGILHSGHHQEGDPQRIFADASSPITRQNENIVTEHKTDAQQLTPEERMSQFRELMSDIVGHAIAQNNEELSQNIGKEVEERILKEMNYLMREQDNAQEERFKKLNEAIRGNVKQGIRSGHFTRNDKIESKELKKNEKNRFGFSKA